MSKQKNKLIIVAHPDDESIFFGGLMLSSKKATTHLVCVTDGNADGDKSNRQKQFLLAANKFGVDKIHFFNLPDRYNKRLSIKKIQEKLHALEKLLKPQLEIYTHGPIGEYGHPHHQDVSFAVHQYYRKKRPVYSPAYNCAADTFIHLNEKLFLEKAKIMSQIYFSETNRFINILPATTCEGFCKIDLREATSIYQFFVHSKLKSPKYLKKYKWFLPYFTLLRDRIKTRLF